jgi:C-terminal processing protease CtpA/Prc
VPLRTYRADRYRYCNWNYVRCDYTTAAGIVVEDVRWYLGVRGLILPGKGLGIEAIEAGSPAEFAGLKQGMVITRINGTDLVDEAIMGQVIENSGGLLDMEVLDKLDGKVFAMSVQMKRLVNSSF